MTARLRTAAGGHRGRAGGGDRWPAPRTRTARPCCGSAPIPNNLPFSNEAAQGFENKIAERLAQALGADLAYTWWAQRRGFVRNTLKAGTCDVVIGVPAALEMVAHTRPYYRSSYVFVDAPGCHRSGRFDDPALRRLRVGIAAGRR